MSAFITLLDELRKNTRLRLGIWLIVAILIIYTITLANDEQKRWQQEYHTAATRLTQLQQLLQQTQWNQHANQAKSLIEQLEAKLWQAETQGLAQASFQKWLNDKIQAAKIENTNLQIEPALLLTTPENIWRVTARLQGNFVAKQLDSLLLSIATNPQMIILENVEIRGKAYQPKFSLIIHAYFQLPANMTS